MLYGQIFIFLTICILKEQIAVQPKEKKWQLFLTLSPLHTCAPCLNLKGDEETLHLLQLPLLCTLRAREAGDPPGFLGIASRGYTTQSVPLSQPQPGLSRIQKQLNHSKHTKTGWSHKAKLIILGFLLFFLLFTKLDCLAYRTGNSYFNQCSGCFSTFRNYSNVLEWVFLISVIKLFA